MVCAGASLIRLALLDSYAIREKRLPITCSNSYQYNPASQLRLSSGLITNKSIASASTCLVFKSSTMEKTKLFGGILMDVELPGLEAVFPHIEIAINKQVIIYTTRLGNNDTRLPINNQTYGNVTIK